MFQSSHKQQYGIGFLGLLLLFFCLADPVHPPNFGGFRLL